MEVDFIHENGSIYLKRKLQKNEMFNIRNTPKSFTISIQKTAVMCDGISSMTDDNHHVLFIDWDYVPDWLPIKDIMLIQEKFKTPPHYLFCSSEITEENSFFGEKIHEKFGNYHAVCLAKYHPQEIREMLGVTHCDALYVTIPNRTRYKAWVLRVGKKGIYESPQFIKAVGNMENMDKQISSAHL